MKKQLLSFLLALCFTLTLLPGAALAEETGAGGLPLEDGAVSLLEGGSRTLNGECGFGDDSIIWKLSNGVLTFLNDSGQGRIASWEWEEKTPASEKDDVRTSTIRLCGGVRAGFSSGESYPWSINEGSDGGLRSTNPDAGDSVSETTITLSSDVPFRLTFAYREENSSSNHLTISVDGAIVAGVRASIVGHFGDDDINIHSSETSGTYDEILSAGSHELSLSCKKTDAGSDGGEDSTGGGYIYDMQAIPLPPWYAYRETIVGVEVPSGITYIGASAFYGCVNLASATLNDGMESFSDSLFSGCSSLSYIVLPTDLKKIGASVFSGCTALTSLSLSSGVTSIGDSAFSGCNSLASLALPIGLVSIGASAFSGCAVLSSLDLPASLKRIGDSAFSGCASLTNMTIPEGVTVLPANVFSDCAWLNRLRLPSGVNEIGENAFLNCRLLTLQVSEQSFAEDWALTHSIPYVYDFDSTDRPLYDISGQCGADGDSIFWTLKDGALGFINRSGQGRIASWEEETAGTGLPPWYAYREQITSAVFPSGISYIGDTAFRGCVNLASVTFSDGITLLNDALFSGCAALVEVTLPTELKEIGASAFSGCAALTSLSLPASVTSIGPSAFSGCVSLTGIEIPAGVKELPSSIFSGCAMLTSLALPTTIENIGESALSGCALLAELRIPEGITALPANVFSGCAELSALWLPYSLEEIPEGAFDDCSKLKLYVYNGSRARRYAFIHDIPFEEISAQLQDARLDRESLELIPGETWQLNVTLTPPNVADPIYSWTTGNPSVATVKDGLVTAVGYGTTRVYVQVQANSDTGTVISKECVVTVAPPVLVTGVTLDRTNLILGVGEGAQLTATVTPENARNPAVVWSSADETVATVDATGMVTMQGEGETWITVTTVDGELSASCDVGTPVNATGIQLDKTSVVLGVGRSVRLNASFLPKRAAGETVRWSSTKPEVATVSEDGVVRGESKGTASIFATIHVKEEILLNAICIVEVTDAVIPVTSVHIMTEELSPLEPGASVTLNATVMPETATDSTLLWSSANPRIAVVSDGGVVTAVAPGSTQIRVTTQDGGFASEVTVRVVAAADELLTLVVDVPSGITVVQGTALNVDGIKVYAVYSDGREAVSGYHIRYTTEQVGPQNVTVSYGGRDASFPITVIERQIASLTVAQLPIQTEYQVGDRANYNGIVLRAEYNDGSEELVTDLNKISFHGFSSAAAGNATVTVSYRGASATFRMTVRAPGAVGTASVPQAPSIGIQNVPGGKWITLTAVEAGAEIYYSTTPNREPDQRYAGPFLLTETATIRAQVRLGNVSSSVNSYPITVGQVEPLTPSHENGSQLPAGTLISLRTPTNGATIYYTLDGREPGTDSIRYSSGIVVGGDTTIKAVAMLDGSRSSAVQTLNYWVPSSGAVETASATLSLGSVTGKAGDILSAPVYIFLGGAEKITEFRFTLQFDPDVFDYHSIVPGPDIAASQLMTASDRSAGTLTVLFNGAAASGEMFTLNLKANDAATDQVSGLVTKPGETLLLKTGAASPLVNVTPGNITLLDSYNSKVLKGEVIFRDGDNEITSLPEGMEDLNATLVVEPAAPDSSLLPDFADVYVALYSSSGMLLKVQSWNIALSGTNMVFMRDIQIPKELHVGRIKIMVLSEDMVPLMAASGISS